jgi:2'-5' RNA ligase
VDSAGRIRAFFALPLGLDARDEVVRAGGVLRQAPWAEGVRWVPAENLHVTLRFLGDLEVDVLQTITDAARRATAGAQKFSCQLSRLTAFPRPSQARVIVASLSDEPNLSVLATAIDQAARACGLGADGHRFRAHATLGRVRRPPLRGVSLEAPLAPCPFEPAAVVLYQSRLSPSGARYEALASLPIGVA